MSKFPNKLNEIKPFLGRWALLNLALMISSHGKPKQQTLYQLKISFIEIVPGRISLTKVWASHKGKRYVCLFIFSIFCSARQIKDDSVKWAPWLRIDWYKLEQYKSEWLNSPVWATSSYYQWQPWFNLQWREINFFGTSVGIQWFECSQTSDLLPKLLVEGDESLYLPKW